jgi:hypothetical protein
MHTLLRKLGVDRRNLRALPLLPLAEVAWADGRIQPDELRVIRDLATDRGIPEDAQILLDGWLAYPPTSEYLRAGRLALSWYRRHGDPSLDPNELRSIGTHARAVAGADGGLFGFGAICRAEREALKRIVADIESAVDHGFVAPEGHPDFHRKHNPVTLAYASSPDGAEQADAVLQPLFDVPMRLPLRECETWIGTSDDSDVRLVDDPDVVPSHCVIDRTPSGFVARALDGRVWINGERVKERRLLGGETIRISPAVSFVFKWVRGWDEVRPA